MNIAVLLLFCFILITCLLTGIPIVLALAIGLVLFLFYGKMQKKTLKELFHMCLSGMNKSKTILLTFILIGLLTAIWRASGCIPTIVCYASYLISPKILVFMTFLLCCLVSFLTGTSFGSAATMGVICTTIAQSMNVPLLWIGGAMLSGIYFGDRCSPVSTSALLVATLTETDIYSNIKNMFKTALVPFAATSIIYLAAGFFLPAGSILPDIQSIFEAEFRISAICLLPAVVILMLALFKIKVRLLMTASILTALPIALFLQKISAASLIKAFIFGYRAESDTLGKLLNGGGLTSMVNVSCIILISSCYSGIFEGTGLLNFLDKPIQRVADRIDIFPTFSFVSLLTASFSLNQTLTVILTHQIAGKLQKNSEQCAIDLEDSAILLSALIPWAIPATVPLAAAGAPLLSISLACYLYLLPLWRIISKQKI